MGRCPPATHSITYTFDSDTIHPDFKNLRTARDPAVYSLKARPGFLRLRGGQSPISYFGQTLLARRQTDFAFKAEAKLEYSPDYFQQLAGLTWRYDERNQYLLAVTHDEKKGRIMNVLTFIAGVFERGEDVVVPDDGPLWLGLTVNTRFGRFRYSVDGKNWVELRPELDAGVLSDEHDSLGFTGAFVGMFCVDTERYAKSADFEYFSYTVL
jgi:xylan 1,4-beta-xylosidase